MSKTSPQKTESAPEAALAEIPAGMESTLATMTPAGMMEMAREVVGLASETQSTSPPGSLAQASVTGEIAEAGPAFGTLLEKVGMAVATTQRELDKSMVETARQLSETRVNVPVIFEQRVDDNGDPMKGEIHMQELPVISIVTPTALQFTQVHLTADMDVERFTNETGITVKRDHTGFHANAKASYGLIGGFGASGSASTSVTRDRTDLNTAVANTRAAGKLHMEATIEPRTIELPRPFIVQNGPRLNLSLSQREDLDATGQPATDAASIVARRVTITAFLVSTAGEALKQKELKVSCDGAFAFTTTPTKTDDEGKMTIVVTRTGITPEKAGLMETTVRASMGLVTASLDFGI